VHIHTRANTPVPSHPTTHHIFDKSNPLRQQVIPQRLHAPRRIARLGARPVKADHQGGRRLLDGHAVGALLAAQDDARVARDHEELVAGQHQPAGRDGGLVGQAGDDGVHFFGRDVREGGRGRPDAAVLLNEKEGRKKRDEV